MKKDIHPEFDIKSKVECACGAKFEVGSTESEIKVEICSACHPFYTGQEKVLDTAGRVEKFKTRAKAMAEKKPVKSRRPEGSGLRPKASEKTTLKRTSATGQAKK